MNAFTTRPVFSLPFSWPYSCCKKTSGWDSTMPCLDHPYRTMNRETSERLQYLLLQWLEGRETPGEAEELSQALADASVPDEDWDNLQEELMAAEPLMAGYDVAAWQPVIEGLIRRNRAAAGPVRVRRMRRWMAAAAVLVLLAGGVWLLRPGTKPPTVVAPAVVHDLLPGGNKATLTLANGQRIVLDSAANGLLAQ